eukprot:UN1235
MSSMTRTLRCWPTSMRSTKKRTSSNPQARPALPPRFCLAHFGFAIPSFLPREVLCDIPGRVVKASAKQWVRCNTIMACTTWDPLEVPTCLLVLVTLRFLGGLIGPPYELNDSEGEESGVEDHWGGDRARRRARL